MASIDHMVRSEIRKLARQGRLLETFHARTVEAAKAKGATQ
ncbi:hypothetical protein [Pseudogemmobacter bohemicus]|nr:hypothetical protein [Pseudogemmobacter bohemicus]